MGSFVNGLKKLFGSKEERDMKAVAPILDKVLEEYKRVDALSDDDLRAESQKIKKVILDRIAPDEGKKRELRNKLEDVTISADDKEKCATEVDKLVKQIDEEMLQFEWEHLMLQKPLIDNFVCWSAGYAKRRFLETYAELSSVVA